MRPRSRRLARAWRHRLPVRRRRAYLQETLSFTCGCARCEAEAAKAECDGIEEVGDGIEEIEEEIGNE